MFLEETVSVKDEPSSPMSVAGGDESSQSEVKHATLTSSTPSTKPKVLKKGKSNELLSYFLNSFFGYFQHYAESNIRTLV